MLKPILWGVVLAIVLVLWAGWYVCCDQVGPYRFP